MALHPVSLPPQAARLFRVVVLLKRLLQALADPSLTAGSVDTAWVQQVWQDLDNEWVRKFCLRGQEARIQAIAAAPPAARQALFHEFVRQNKVLALLQLGGDFRDLSVLTDVDNALARNVRDFFRHCYKRLSHSTSESWPGYAFRGNRSICNRDYKDAFCSRYPASVVCPYCDGEIGTPELDHYLFKHGFPLLVCSPWNLVPVCASCNDAITAKGDRPALTEGNPRSMENWLHPFFRPASSDVCIKLSGAARSSIPRLHSADPSEQVRLDNHSDLIRSLSKRWTNRAASYLDELVGQVGRRRTCTSARTTDEIVREQLDDHLAVRGRSPSSLIKAAVCQAVLDHRPEYFEEFDEPNRVDLV